MRNSQLVFSALLSIFEELTPEERGKLLTIIAEELVEVKVYGRTVRLKLPSGEADVFVRRIPVEENYEILGLTLYCAIFLPEELLLYPLYSGNIYVYLSALCPRDLTDSQQDEIINIIRLLSNDEIKEDVMKLAELLKKFDM